MKAQPRSSAEPWLRGPIPGISPLLMPAAHCLEQVIEDLTHFVAPLTDEQIWAKPAGAPSVGFHLRHIHGSIDRLLTYADARSLSEQQIKALAAETDAPSQTLDSQILLKEVLTRIDQAIAAIRFTKESDLLEPRAVGRANLPTNVLGLLFHLAEHTQRHTGQIISTATIARGMHPSSALSPSLV